MSLLFCELYNNYLAWEISRKNATWNFKVAEENAVTTQGRHAIPPEESEQSRIAEEDTTALNFGVLKGLASSLRVSGIHEEAT